MNLFENKIRKTKPKDFSDYNLVHDYKCPNCQTTPSDEPYFSEGDELWPKYYNRSESHTDAGLFYYWDEYHSCKECQTKFWLKSGN